MTLFIALAIIAADEPAPTVRLPPPTSLALDVAEAVAARVQKLALATDASISEAERADALAALTRTSLFTITDAPLATATLSLTRVDPEAVLATVTAADNNRLWVGRVHWPTLVPAPESTGPAGTDGEAVYKGILRYKRDRIRVVPIAHSWTPAVFGYEWFLPDRPYDPSLWGAGYTPAMPVSTAPNDWALMRGAADVIDELALAKLLEDEPLAKRIEEARFWPQLFWASGFGAGALAGVGTGIWLSGFKDRDTRAFGISLVTVGVVSAVLALMFQSAGPTHVLSEPEAQDRADDYNEALRAKLGLSGEDIARHLPGD